MEIVKTRFGAYGMGVEYAYTMVDGPAASFYPRFVATAAAAYKLPFVRSQ
jgi:hypothetical protein